MSSVSPPGPGSATPFAVLFTGIQMLGALHKAYADEIRRSQDNFGTAATDTTLDMRNKLVWDWRGGYGTLIWYGARANIVNNFYSSPQSSPKNQTQALIVGTKEDSREGLTAAARVYASGNFSADKLDQDVNSSGNEKNPLPAAPVDSQDACAAAHAVLSGAGVRPLDSVDQRYISAISFAVVRGQRFLERSVRTGAVK